MSLFCIHNFTDYLPAVVKELKGIGFVAEYYVIDSVTGNKVRQRVRLQNMVKRLSSRREKMAVAVRVCAEINQSLEARWEENYRTKNEPKCVFSNASSGAANQNRNKIEPSGFESLDETTLCFSRLPGRGTDDRRTIPLSMVRERFVEHKRSEGLRPATLQSYSSMTSLLVEWCKRTGRGRVSCSGFRKIDAVEYLDYIIEKGNSNRNYNNTLKQLKLFFSWCVANCYCESNPFDGLKLRAKTEKRRILIDAESRRRIAEFFREYCPQMLLVCRLIYSSAMRPKEIANIRIQDIDLEARCVHVPAEVAKNRHARNATLSQDLIDELRPVVGRGLPGEWYLFGSNQRIEPSAKRVALSNFRKKWDVVRERLNLPREMQLYSFRDTGLVDLLHAGVDQLTVRQHADHSSLAMQDIYTSHYDPELNKRIFEAGVEF